MKLKPNFLLIGAMKSGTSSLYAELKDHPEIFFPEHKEPNGLVSIANRDASDIDRYYRLYDGRKERILGDASTGYSKAPLRPQVAGTARKYLGDTTKILYVTRDPLKRAIRHVAHNYGNGLIEDTAGEILSRVDYAAVSSYAMQLSYWSREFSPENILVVEFENYLKNRVLILRSIEEFLCLSAPFSDSLERKSQNRGDSRRSAYGSSLQWLVHSKLYRALKQYFPKKIRRIVADLTLPLAKNSSVELSPIEEQCFLNLVKNMDELVAPDYEEIVSVFENTVMTLKPKR